jgi:hypothetical protein
VHLLEAVGVSCLFSPHFLYTMSSPRTFFNACLGLTLILPLFFVDLEAIGLVGKTGGNTVEANSDDVVRFSFSLFSSSLAGGAPSPTISMFSWYCA